MRNRRSPNCHRHRRMINFFYNLKYGSGEFIKTVDELCGVNTPEPGTELEREIMRAVRDVLREYEVQKIK